MARRANFLTMPSFRVALACLVLAMHVQAEAPWHLFEDSRTGNLGYQDAAGRTMVPAIFSQPTSARVFHNVVAVFEADTSDAPSRSRVYFLHRNGLTFGHDSVPLLAEFTPPCESEGTILFQDSKSDRFGYFDSTGMVTIPARYLDAGSFHGGYAVVLENGQRLCGDGKEWSSRNACEHWYWKGVRKLIDRQGRTVIDSFVLPQQALPDWLHVRRSASDPDTTRHRLRTVTGEVLSFPDHLREFRAWFSSAFPRMRKKGAAPSDFLPRLYLSPHRDWRTARRSGAREGSWPVTDPVKFLRTDGPRLVRFLDRLDRSPSSLDIAACDGFLHAAELGLQDACGNPDPVHHPSFEVRSIAPDGLLLRSVIFVRAPEGFRIAEID
jgi:WG containing repeat